MRSARGGRLWSAFVHPKRLQTWIITALAVAVLGLVMGTTRWIQRDRAALARQFSDERLEALREAVSQVESDLADITEDLRFVGQLLAGMPSDDDRRRTLSALLGTVRPYHAAALYERAGEPGLSVVDPRLQGGLTHEQLALLDATASRVLEAPLGTVDVSLPLTEGDRWVRAFAVPVRGGIAGPPKAIALLVDTAPLLAKLRFVASDPNTHLLLLGPHGHPAPSTSPQAAELVRSPPASGAFADLLRALSEGRAGTTRIDAAEASRLGMTSADVIAAYAPLRVEGGRRWSVATLTSMAPLRTHERSIIVRLALAALLIAAALVAAGVYVVGTSRQQALLRERLRHADEVAHLHEKARTILESMPTSVLVLDEAARITDANGAMQRRWPHVVGLELAQALRATPDARAAIEGLVAVARGSSQPQTILGHHWALFDRDGHYAVHAVPLHPPATHASMLLVFEDFTDLRALESQLLRAEKLTTVGVLAAGIAHEIGTPLGVVRGRAEYVAGKLGPAHPQSSSLRVIVEQIERITGTIRELLDFSRAKSVALLPVDLRSVTDRSLALLRYEIERRHVDVSVELPAELPALSADADQLQQVLVNLLLNAFDACAAGGHVQVRAAVRARTGSAAGDICIEVQDDGCGIPPSDVNRVFDPFFTTKKRGQGTGLGLSIVAQIVRSHGATIELDSHAGGTRVIMNWPASRGGERASAA